MVARADAIVEHVRSGDYNARLKAVREMKNQVVGSRAKKLQYLRAGAVPLLVAILASEDGSANPVLVVQVRLPDGGAALTRGLGAAPIVLSAAHNRMLGHAGHPGHHCMQSGFNIKAAGGQSWQGFASSNRTVDCCTFAVCNPIACIFGSFHDLFCPVAGGHHGGQSCIQAGGRGAAGADGGRPAAAAAPAAGSGRGRRGGRRPLPPLPAAGAQHANACLCW